MNFKNSLAGSAALLLLAGLNVAAKPAPPLPTPEAHLYVVFSGTSTDSTFDGGSTSTATTKHVSTVYLILDLANPSNFSALLVHADKSYGISTRVLSADGTAVTSYNDGTVQSGGNNPGHNFINGLENQAKSNSTSPTKGYAVFRFSGGQTDSVTIDNVTHVYPTYTEVYATGALTGLSIFTATTIVPADSKAKVSGVYTIDPVEPALTNYIGVTGNANTISYPTKLSGQIFDYGYDATLVAVPIQNFPAIDFLDVSGTITLTLNTTLTSLANVGGTFKLKGQVTPPVTINPVAGPLTASGSATIYEDFLAEIVQSLALPAGYTPTP